MAVQTKPVSIVQPDADYLADEVARMIRSQYRTMQAFRREHGANNRECARIARWVLVNLLEIRRNARYRTAARQRIAGQEASRG